MGRIGAVVFGATVLGWATVASAQAQNVRASDASQSGQASWLQGHAEANAPRALPLATVGGVEVYLWAPVEPSYDSHANRNFTADPLWEADMGTAPSGF